VHRQDSRNFARSLQKQVAVIVDGIELSFDVQVYSIQTPTKVSYRVIIFRDVTHLKRERTRIEALNAQLKQLNAELTERASRLEAANKELDSFAYIASHDLQEPFRHIEIFVQFLERDLGVERELPQEIEYLLQQIVKNVDVAKRMLADLRTLSRVTRMRNPYRNVALVDLVEEVLRHGHRAPARVFAFDDLPDTIQGVKDGYINGIMVQRPVTMGKLAVEQLVSQIKGDAPGGDIDTGVTVVNADNLDSYTK